MSKHIYTIQSSDKKEFDKEMNFYLQCGGELLEGSYKLIKNDDGVIIYSHVLVFDSASCEVGFFDNGKINYICGINNRGERHGKSCGWYENGNKQYENLYVNDCDVKNISWYENGQKREECHYAYGWEINGKWTHWYENGKKWSVGNWVYSKRNGKWTQWYENGKKWFEENHKDGKKHGKFIRWFSNGKKEYEVMYKNGKRNGASLTSIPGLSREYHPSGYIKGTYRNGRKDGKFTYCNNKDGINRWVQIWKYGKLIEQK